MIDPPPVEVADNGMPALSDAALFPGAIEAAADALFVRIAAMARRDAANVAEVMGPGDPHLIADVARRVARSVVGAWRRRRLVAPNPAALGKVVRRQVWLAMQKARRAAARRRETERAFGEETAALAHDWMDPGVAGRRDELVEAIAHAANTLSRRQREVLLLLYDGRTREEIATTLGIRPETVKTFVKQLYPRMRAALAEYAGAGRGAKP